MIDSGSSDRSREIAARGRRRACSRSRPAEFGHGHTRNLGVERTSGELVCFLTQDAVPLAGLAGRLPRGVRARRARRRRLRPAPAAARDEPDDRARADRVLRGIRARTGAPVAAAAGRHRIPLERERLLRARACWEEIRFRDVDYAEDQAFGARHARGRLERRSTSPRAGVLHAHDYGPVEFTRRYFDEYRGLRRDDRPRGAGGARRGRARGRRRGGRPALDGRAGLRPAPAPRLDRALGAPPLRRASCRGPRLARRAAARRACSGAVARAPRPRRARAPKAGAQRPRRGAAGPAASHEVLDSAATARRRCSSPVPGRSSARASAPGRRRSPPSAAAAAGTARSSRSSGGSSDMGHTCSVWLHDPARNHRLARPRGAAQRHRRLVRARARRRCSRASTSGTAPTWRWPPAGRPSHPTAAAAGLPRPRLPRARPRARVLRAPRRARCGPQDTYRLGLYPICAQPLAARPGAPSATAPTGLAFRLGVDHTDLPAAAGGAPRDTVIFYARAATPRRAVPLGLLALEELQRAPAATSGS